MFRVMSTVSRDKKKLNFMCNVTETYAVLHTIEKDTV